MEKFKNIIKSNKGRVFISVLVLIIFGVGIKIYTMYPNAERVYNDVKYMDDTDMQIAFIERELDGKGMFGDKEKEVNVEVLKMLADDINSDFKESFGVDIEEFNKVTIENFEKKSKGYKSDYYDFEITVNNGSSTPIQYIEFTIYYKDKSGNVIDSEWTNDSNIPANSKKVVTKMTDKEGWEDANVEITDIRF